MCELWPFQLGFFFFSDFKENVPIESFNISFESTQNKQLYVTKITYTEVRGRGGGVMVSSLIVTTLFQFFVVLTSSPLF